MAGLASNAWFEDETLWLNTGADSGTVPNDPANVTLSPKTIFAEEELSEEATCKDYLQVRREGTREVTRKLRHYRLEAILATGCGATVERSSEKKPAWDLCFQPHRDNRDMIGT